jgi:hypothetical protein
MTFTELSPSSDAASGRMATSVTPGRVASKGTLRIGQLLLEAAACIEPMCAQRDLPSDPTPHPRLGSEIHFRDPCVANGLEARTDNCGPAPKELWPQAEILALVLVECYF